MKFWILLIWICSFFISIAGEIDSGLILHYRTRISACYSESKYDSIIYYGIRLNEAFSKGGNKNGSLVSMCYIVEACFNLNNYTLAKKYYDQIDQYIKLNQLHIRPILEDEELTILYNYYYYQGRFFEHDGKLQHAIATFFQLSEFIKNHPDHYGSIQNLDTKLKDPREVRFYQCYLNIGRLNILIKNYNEAKENLSKAWFYAKIVDSVIHLKKLIRYNFTPRVLSEYLQLAIKEGNQLEWNHYFDFNDKSSTNNLAIKSFFKELLASDGMVKKNPESENAIKILKSLSGSKTDPEEILNIIDYYLQTNQLSLADKEFIYFDHHIASRNISILTQTNVDLTRARRALIHKDYANLNSFVLDALRLLRSRGIDTTGEIGPCLAAYSKSLTLYRAVYHASFDKKYLTESMIIGDQVIDMLIRLRQNGEQGQDRSVLMKEFSNLVNTMVSIYYLAVATGEKINYNKLLAYLEINKSFNLLNETKLKKEHFTPQQTDSYNLIIKQIDYLNYQINKSKNKLNDSLEFQKSFYFDQKKNMLASSHIVSWQLPSIDSIQFRLIPGEIILDYYMDADSSVYVLIISKDTVDFKRLNMHLENLDHWIKDFHYCMQNFNTLDQPIRDSMWAWSSFQLYLHLIKPFVPDRIKKIIMISDGHLSLIPIGSLLTDISNNAYTAWKFLILRYRVSSQPSLKIWYDYNFSHPNTSTKSLALLSPSTNLRHNQTETNVLRKLFNHAVTIDQNIYMTTLTTEVKDYDVLHIASHAKSDITCEFNTYIRGSRDSINAAEISNQVFKQEMIFLSACETGLGEQVQGEGIFSLARSFFKAGAQSVISTLWKVNDQFTSKQVALIYSNLLLGMSKDDAIRDMQLHYIRADDSNGANAMPYYWAAYQCQGDLRPVVGLRQKDYLWMYAVSISILMGLWYYKKSLLRFFR